LAVSEHYRVSREPEVPLNLVMRCQTGYLHELEPPPGRGDLQDEV
jgi:hypothetical protein